MKKAHINLTLDQSIIQWIDNLRGNLPRSSFINQVLGKYCADTNNVFNWIEQDQQAEEDIRNKKVRKFKNASEAVRWLKS